MDSTKIIRSSLKKTAIETLYDDRFSQLINKSTWWNKFYLTIYGVYTYDALHIWYWIEKYNQTHLKKSCCLKYKAFWKSFVHMENMDSIVLKTSSILIISINWKSKISWHIENKTSNLNIFSQSLWFCSVRF